MGINEKAVKGYIWLALMEADLDDDLLNMTMDYAETLFDRCEPALAARFYENFRSRNPQASLSDSEV